MIDATASTLDNSMTPTKSSLPLYHSHHRGRGNGIRKRLLKRSKLAVLLLLFVVICFCSYSRSFLYTINLRAAESIATKLELARQVPADKELATLNKRLARMTVDDIIKWAYKHFPPQTIVDVTSFGPSGLVLLHKLKTLHLPEHTPVVTIDTLHLFSATYHFIESIQQHDLLHGVTVQTYRPRDCSSQQDFDDKFGKDLYKTDPERYAYLSKVKPTLRALEATSAILWLTGRRRSQGGERSTLNVLEIDTSTATSNAPRYKLNPLAFWSYDQVWTYIRVNNIPYNPLHDEGYKSIGDWMTTAPVLPSGQERSGRFVGLHTTECGIHATRTKIQRMKQQAENEGRDFDGVASLQCGSNCVEVTKATFDNVILNDQTAVDVLLEVYSPMCGACQEFAPKFESVASQLLPYGHQIQIARFDITEQDVPQSGEKIGLDVQVTPSLFLVKRNPIRVVPYTGKLTSTSVLKWIQRECDNIQLES